MSDFNVTERDSGRIWTHSVKPAWIVFYPGTNDSKAFYQAYVVKDYCLPAPKGRNFWTLDNRRIGNEKSGFASLDAAKIAVNGL